MKHLDVIQQKIYEGTTPALGRQLYQWKFSGKKLVFTNGCFDILHLGHIDYLCKAADLGDKLIIGVNRDLSVSTLKGPHRPITDENSRAMLLAALHFVDAVIFFSEETPKELIEFVVPQVLVKGADYKKEDIIGYETVTSNGGTVETIEFLPGYSTSAIEKRIKASII